MADEPHISEAEWTRLWAHTLTSQERRRIAAAVRDGVLLEVPAEALLAAELARRMRTGRRPAAWLVWANVLLGLGMAALVVYRWPVQTWLDLLLLALPALNLANFALSRRAHPGTPALLQYERDSLARSEVRATA